MNTPKGVVPYTFGKEGKGQEVNYEEAIVGMKLKDAVRKERKRLRYLADDTVEEEEREEDEENELREKQEGRQEGVRKEGTWRE